MKKILISALLTAFTLGTFTSCSKYEDGPVVSLRSKTERISNIWIVDRAYEDGKDVTDSYNEFELELTKENFARLSFIYTSDNFSFEYKTEGSWRFSGKKEDLVLDFENNDADETYEILRLKETELWLLDREDNVEIQLIPR